MNERINVEVSGVFKVGENTELDENVTPDFLGEIEKRKLSIAELDRDVQMGGNLDIAEATVKSLEAEIYQLEQEQGMYSRREEIAERKSRIEDINTAVQQNQISTGEADSQVSVLEREIYELEDSLRDEKGVEKGAELIQSVTNFVELYTTLDRLQNVSGSDGHEYSIDYLKEKIDQVRNGERTTDYITRSLGLRSKVEELLKVEKGSLVVEEGDQSEDTEAESLSPEAIAEREIIREHFRLKKEMLAARTAYYGALDKQYKDPSVLKTTFGIGRDKLRGAALEAYDQFQEKSGEFYNYHEGYAVVEERRQRLAAARTARTGETVADFNLGLAKVERHLNKPEDVRLEKQKHHLPESVRSKLDLLSKKFNENPEALFALGAATVTGLVLSGLAAPLTIAAGMGAGFGTRFGTRWAGNKWYVGGKQAELEEFKAGAVDRLNQLGVGGMRQMAEELHQAERMVQKARVRTKVGSVAAGVFAGVAAAGTAGSIDAVFSGSESVPVGGEGAIDTSAVDEAVRLYTENPDVFSVESEPGVGAEDVLPTESSFEAIHTVERGEVLSKIVLESLQERVLAGEVQLPEGVDQDRLAHYMYQSFPEMTSASDIQPRLSAAEWQALGVESGNPHLIRPGEQINIDALIDEMWGANPGGGVSEVQDALSNGILGSDELPSELDEVQEATPEVSQQIGVSDIDSLETPGSTNSEALDIRPRSESIEEISDVVKPEVLDTIKPEVLATIKPEVLDTISTSEMPTASSVETASEVPLNNRSAKLYEMLRGDFSDPDMVKAAMNELTSGYQPIMSERLAELTTPWQPGKTLHEHLYQTMLESYRAGNMSLPFETMRYVEANETALYGFIEKYLPDVSENTLSKFFRGVGPNVLTAEQWQELGIGSGNPKMIASGDQVQMGEIIKLMLERSAQAVNKT